MTKITCNELLQTCAETVDSLQIENKICDDINKKKTEEVGAQKVELEKLNKKVDRAETKAELGFWGTVGSVLIILLHFI